MGTDMGSSVGAKVYESKKEKKRRLAMMGEIVIGLGAETAVPRNVVTGTPSGVLEKADGGEIRVTRGEGIKKKLGGEESRGNGVDAKSEIEGAELVGNRTDGAGERVEGNVSELKSDKKRSLEEDDEISRKKTRVDCIDIVEQEQDENLGEDTSLNIVKDAEDVQVSEMPVLGDKDGDVECLSEGKLQPSLATRGKAKRWRRGRRPGSRKKLGGEESRGNSEGADSVVNRTDGAGESVEGNASELKSDKKRCLEEDDEISRKETKVDCIDSVEQEQDENLGEDKRLNIVKDADDVQVSEMPILGDKDGDVDCLSEEKLQPSLTTRGKAKTWRRGRRPGTRNARIVKDGGSSDIGVKDEDGGRSLQGRYSRMHGKGGILRVLQSRKKVLVPDIAIGVKVKGIKRKLRSPGTNIKKGKIGLKISSEDAAKPSINQVTVSPLEGNSVSAAHNTEKTKKSDTSRSEMKNKIRDHIKNIILNAGWTIELRPRKGRNYEDSIYVSPQGSGYWSITKAYDVYLRTAKRACDDKEGSEKESNSPADKEAISTFEVIAPEVLHILKRNVVNRRRGKKEMEEAKRKSGVGRKKKKAKDGIKVKGSKDKGMRGMKRKLMVKNSKRRGCALLVRGSNKDEGSEGDYTPYIWKRTVLSWMMDLGLFPAYEKVSYMNKRRTKALMDGRITRDGIECSCCSKIFSVSKFEVHAGSKLHQPYENICMEVSGISLLQCQINAWEKQESVQKNFYDVNTEGDDPNDDSCGICADGGDLICCDSCPSTFHLGCLGIEMLPTGDWHCANCSCKFCGSVHVSTSQDGNASSALFTCLQCAQKYHKGCVPEDDAVPNVSNSSSNTFCRRSCRKVFRNLLKLIGVRHELETGFYWSVVCRFDDPSKSPSSMSRKVESNSKIAVAYAVMDECFVPIVDQRSGINLIHNVVYNCGANFNRLNFSGFYTFILERGDEIVAAASVRIHDIRMAEMPFIGTRSMYRRQGMCRRLLKGIESALRSLCVRRLIIPAISELTETWTTVFGFMPLDISQQEEVKFMNMLVFPGTGLLQKSLLKDSNKHHANPELENKPETQIKICQIEIIDSNESKCDADAIVLESSTNALQVVSGCHGQFYKSLGGAANLESHDLQNASSCSNNTEKDVSSSNCSNEMDAFIEEPKKEIKDAINTLPNFQRPPSEPLHGPSGIEVSGSRPPKDVSTFESSVSDVYEDISFAKEDDSTLKFLQKSTSKPLSNGVTHEASLEKCELTQANEDISHEINVVKLKLDNDESNIKEAAVEITGYVRRHLSTSPGSSYTSSECCCAGNPKLNCVASNESISQEKSELLQNQLKCYFEANDSAPVDQLLVSDSAKRLDVDGVSGIVKTFTAYESKFKELIPGVNQHFTSNSEVADDCHDDICDVSILEKQLGVVDMVLTNSLLCKHPRL